MKRIERDFVSVVRSCARSSVARTGALAMLRTLQHDQPIHPDSSASSRRTIS